MRVVLAEHEYEISQGRINDLQLLVKDKDDEILGLKTKLKVS